MLRVFILASLAVSPPSWANIAPRSVEEYVAAIVEPLDNDGDDLDSLTWPEPVPGTCWMNHLTASVQIGVRLRFPNCVKSAALFRTSH